MNSPIAYHPMRAGRWSTLLLLLYLFGGGMALLHAQPSESSAPGAHTDSIQTVSQLLIERRPGYDVSVSPQVSPLYFFSARGSRTDISLGGAIRRDHGTVMVPQLGERDIDGSVEIESSLRQRDNFAWGRASYTYRGTDGIRYNETSDYRLLAPYIMGDTAQTARLHQDRYTFGAGTAHRFGHWLLSLSADYRATFAYRVQDPRPRNLSTLLEGQLGVGYQFADYAVALTGTIGRYKQNNQVGFLSELGVSTEYHFTGVGGDYYRFRGNNTSLFYRGVSYGASLGITPTGRAQQGFYALAAWHLLTTDRIIRELNNLPLSTLQLHSIDAQAGYSSISPLLGRWGVSLYTEGVIRRGAVHLFGDPTGNIYPRIATEHSFYAEQLEMGAEAFCSSSTTTHAPLAWGTTLSVGYRLDEEDLLPQAEQTYYHLVVRVAPHIDFHRGAYAASLTPICRVWVPMGQSQLRLAPQHQPIPGYRETLEQTHQIASARRMEYGLTMRHGFQLNGRYTLWLSLDYMRTQTALSQSDYGAIRCGLSF